MKFTRLFLVVMTLSLAACGSEITGPESSPAPSNASMGVYTLGSGS